MTRYNVSSFLNSSLFICILFISCFSYSAEDLQVVDVHRNIPLSDEEPVVKDFYIAGDQLSNLKKNQTVTVFRKVAIRDASGVHSYGEIEIPVGQLTIIAIFKKVAVARESKLLSRSNLPMLEQIGIMTGDRLDLETATK